MVVLMIMMMMMVEVSFLGRMMMVEVGFSIFPMTRVVVVVIIVSRNPLSTLLKSPLLPEPKLHTSYINIHLKIMFICFFLYNIAHENITAHV